MSVDAEFFEPYGQTERMDMQGFRMQYRKEELHSSKTRTAYKRLKLVPDNTLCTTSYQDSEILDFRLYRAGIIQIINLDTAINILYKILACLSPEYKWTEIAPETTITANASGNASAEETLTDPWAFLKVQYKSASGSPKIKIIAGVRA